MAIKAADLLPGLKQNAAVDFPSDMTIGGSAVVALATVTSSSANALTSGPAGATNPSFNVDASTASAATGVNIKSAAAAGGIAISALSSGTNENMTIDAKGSGTITLGATSTGNIVISQPLIFIRNVVKGTADVTLTAALTGSVYIGTKSSANQTYTLPAANADTAGGLCYTIICGHASGEILVTPAGSDAIIMKVTNDGIALAPAGGTGVKNTAATNVVGDRLQLVSDGSATWYLMSMSGTWASQ